MTKFKFVTTQETSEFCLEVVRCLEIYCQKERVDAINLVNSFWADKETFSNEDYRLHEDPYYWAMCIAHDKVIGDNNLHWDQNPLLWPPPKDFLAYWYG